MLLILALTACTVGPDYSGPVTAAGERFSQRGVGDAPVAATTPWWQSFRDPILDRLVEQAATANAGLQRARAAVAEARAAVRQARGNGMPQLNATVSALSTKSYSPPTYSPVETYGTAGFDASWELDLWGKTARAVEATEANAGAAEATADDAMVTLLGDVAAAYAQLRGLQAQLVIADDSVENQRRDTELAQRRVDGGDGTKLEILQGQASLAAAQAAIPPLQAEARVTINALSVLCGEPPNALSGLLAPAAAIPQAPLPGLGVPADLVRRRPDVRVAERAVATSVAQVGVALAAEYPTLTLTGSLTLSGNSIAQILATPLFAIGPAVSLPVFDGGVRAAQVDIQRSRVDQARWVYRGAVLAALQEVENSLARLQGDQAQRTKLAEAVDIAREQLRIAKIQYVIGSDGFFQVLDAQHAVDNAKMQLVQSETALATDTVAFFKALGGGWDVAHGPAIQPGAAFAPVPQNLPIRPAPPIPDVGQMKRPATP